MFSKLRIFFLILALGLALHFFPNVGIPLHSDVTWFYRMQTTTDERVIAVIPAGMREIGAYPNGFLKACTSWYSYSARFNCGDIVGQRLMAKFAGSNADLWRLTNIVLLSGTIFLFYFLLKELRVAKMVAILASLGLFFQPIGVWTDYKSSEPRAIFFLILGFLLILKSNRVRVPYLSALSILIASLTKETFVLAWVLVPALILWKDGKLHISRLVPHFIALLVFVAFYIYLRIFFPVWTSGYVLGSGAETNSLSAPYLILNILRMMPVYFKEIWFIVLFSLILLVEIRFKVKEVFFKTLKFLRGDRLPVLMFSLSIAVLLSALPYLVTGREIFDRYLVPGNFFFTIFVAILVTGLYNHVYRMGKVWTKLVILSLLLFFIFGQIRFVLSHSYQDRIDQEEWQRLIYETARLAPKNGHIVLNFDDPYMVETAYSLEANTIFLGRDDLKYHLFTEDDGGDKFVSKTIELFNKDRAPITTAEVGNILYIKADRNGGMNSTPYLNWQIDE